MSKSHDLRCIYLVMSLDPKALKSQTKSSFLSQYPTKQVFLDMYAEEQAFAKAIWRAKQTKAQFKLGTLTDEVIWGSDLELTEEEMYAATDAYATTKAPYGDVHYCDPGYQADKKKRFPVDTKARAKAALSYSHHKDIMAKYSADNLAKLHACINRAYKHFFGEEPPSQQDK